MTRSMRTFMAAAMLAVSVIFGGTAAFAESGQEVRRTILALYDSRDGRDIQYTRIHRFAEMPLNHLGLVVRYHDINEPFPELSSLSDVRGILTWFEDDKMLDPTGYIEWAKTILDDGLLFVVMGNTGITEDLDGNETSTVRMNEFLELIGFRTERDWVNLTYDIRLIANDRKLLNFERPYQGILPSFEPLKMIDPEGHSILVSRRGDDPETDSDLIATTPAGGLVSSGYAIYRDAKFNQEFWYLNPFAFFRKAYATDDLPKADTTTISGRRAFYSHIDGDGWRNISEIAEFREEKILAAEVILEEVIKRYPQFPVTVAPVTAELDKSWKGTDETRRIAREMFALPHVEIGTHTHSHPFQWAFYDDYSATKEAPYLEAYEYADEEIRHRYPADAHGHVETDDDGNPVLGDGTYAVPRAFLDHPFDIEKEIQGSIEILRELAPEGKPVAILQWSGDTSPTEPMIAAVREAGIPNINGGDSRFDREFPSHTAVSPVGRQVGDELQVYASNSNENTYTDLWQGRYFGFQHLVRTVENTETPVRLKPFNVYYHMYSGQKLSSLNALLRNLEYARQQMLAPIDTSEFARIGQGFFSIRFEALGDHRWRILDRRRLNTIRFDNATFRSVDYERSKGVVGHTHYQGSLYVTLDSEAEEPVIATTVVARSGQFGDARRPYLVNAGWQISGLMMQDSGFGFVARGYGTGEMAWATGRPNNRFRIDVTRDGVIIESTDLDTDENGVATIVLDSSAIDPVQVWVTLVGDS